MLLSTFGLAAAPTITAEIVELRNDLFHETLWAGKQPGVASRAGLIDADHLWRINDRLLFALAGYRSDYLKIPWSNIGLALI